MNKYESRIFRRTDALKFGDSESTLYALLETIDPFYMGLKGAEIKDFIEKSGVSLFEWVSIYNKANGTNLTDKGEGIVDYNLAIGMTALEVEESTWAEPDSINKTVTADIIREQWIYRNGQYLYFEDGILMSFQD